MKVLIATSPFGEASREPLDLLEATGWDLVLNPYRRRVKAGEVADLIGDADAVIAGTEPYNGETLARAQNLKVIARVGIGLDSVDMDYCRAHGVQVTYTPDAPSDAVAELTVANILNLLRHIHTSDHSVREGAWNRLMGVLLREAKIGIVGVGRIGARVIRLLSPFQPAVLATDTDPLVCEQELPNTEWCSIDRVLGEADVVSLHIPLNQENRGFLDRDKIARMKTGARVVNTARGGVLDEVALTDALLQGHLGGAALDVFDSEPYEGVLTRLDNVILTAHIGASARMSRYLMELGAAQDCIRALRGEPVAHDACAGELSGPPQVSG
ncbi:phosphoglycerate dehydrogenase [Verrucomicrobiota bacterium]